MKFSNIWYLSKNQANIGEGIISLALQHIYKQMGIPEDEITWINKDEVCTYDGEDCVFPVISFLQNIESVGCYSKKLHPVFICYVTFAPFTRKEVEILKMYEPIGCRDAYTLKQCERHGIHSYFNGCVTALLPKSNNPRYGKNILSDVETELFPYIPKSILENSTTIKHNMKVDSYAEAMLTAKNFLDLFANAPLCITSRLHCASPAMASGTPVVFAKNELSSRFSWIERHVPIYGENQYSDIRWSPAPLCYEEFKANTIKLITTRLWDTYNGSHTDISEMVAYVDGYYKQRPNNYYPTAFDKLAESICQKRKFSDTFNYGFFGYSPLHGATFEFMTENYPNANLRHIYDNFRVDYTFGGLTAHSIKEASYNPEELIICFSASKDSIQKMYNILERQGRDKKNFIADFHQE